MFSAVNRIVPPPGIACTAQVQRSQALILKILCEQCQRDAAQSEATRGFVHAEDLARRYARLAGRTRPVELRAISQSISKLHTQMRVATRKLGLTAEPKLVENTPRVGYRIAACGLSITRAYRSDAAWC